MGKGDKKTRRGKLFQGSFGVRRRKKKIIHAAPEATQPPKIKEVKAVVPEVKAPKASPAKKEPKVKKTEEPASKHE
jgi:ribosomal small subunit protein bTHX